MLTVVPRYPWCSYNVLWKCSSTPRSHTMRIAMEKHRTYMCGITFKRQHLTATNLRNWVIGAPLIDWTLVSLACNFSTIDFTQPRVIDF